MAKIEKTDTSTTVRLENGPEVFTASDPLELTNQLANSLDEGRRFISQKTKEADEWKEKYETAIQTQHQAAQQAQQAALDPNVAYWKNLAAESAAQALGHPNVDAWKQEEARKAAMLAEQNHRSVVMAFNAKHPEFNS